MCPTWIKIAPITLEKARRKGTLTKTTTTNYARAIMVIYKIYTDYLPLSLAHMQLIDKN